MILKKIWLDAIFGSYLLDHVCGSGFASAEDFWLGWVQEESMTAIHLNYLLSNPRLYKKNFQYDMYIFRLVDYFEIHI